MNSMCLFCVGKRRSIPPSCAKYCKPYFKSEALSCRFNYELHILEAFPITTDVFRP